MSTREPPAAPSAASVATELAMRRTGMAFQRTRMGADRTLMAVIRTSLSLMSFGFTIFQVFKKLKDVGVTENSAAPRRFGITLVLLGIGMLVLGIIYHVLFMLDLRALRRGMKSEGLVHGKSPFPASLTLIIAVLLLLLGLVTAFSMTLHIGPFG